MNKFEGHLLISFAQHCLHQAGSQLKGKEIETLLEELFFFYLYPILNVK